MIVQMRTKSVDLNLLTTVNLSCKSYILKSCLKSVRFTFYVYVLKVLITNKLFSSWLYFTVLLV